MNTARLKMCITVFLILILFFSGNYLATGELSSTSKEHATGELSSTSKEHATGELSSTSKDFTSLYYPHGIDVDSLGNVYVTDSRDLVQKFDANGNFILKWGSSGTADGQFLHPHDVAVSRSGYVYVGDYHIPNVQKFDANGNFILMWGSNGTADGEFLQER